MNIGKTLLLSLVVIASTTGCATTSKLASATTVDANRNVVLVFYREALSNRQVRKAFERYASPDFIEHKPDVGGGTREATIVYLDGLVNSLPNASWEVIRTIAEGDLVFLHARFIPAPGSAPYAIADVFRLRDGLIVEHWDAVGRPPEQQRNPNSRF